MFDRETAGGTWTRERLVAVAAVVWACAVAASLWWNWHQSEQAARRFAEAEARAAYQKDLVYRRWASINGGVYVPPTAATPPNPYLAHIPNRDVVTSGGQALTLVNPAYMTRQVHELGRQQYGTRGHITSLMPLRPENAADPWEAASLQAFEHGAAERVALVDIDGRTYLRLMRPMVTEASCLKCHAAQGYRVGQVRGGLSVSVPFEPYEAAAHEQQLRMGGAHALIAALGFAGLFLWFGQVRRSDRATLEQGRRYGAVLQTATDGFFIVDAAGCLTEVNQAYCAMSGYVPSELLGMHVSDLDAHDDRAAVAARIAAMRERGEARFESQHRRKDGAVFDVEMSVQYKPGFAGQPAYIVSFVRDLTASRRAEAERERLRAQLAGAQRLEAIGRLAGGVAHDFNNMVGVISGYTELALHRLPQGAPARADLQEVLQAAGRSADLTRQLLAFARRQVAAPQVLDLNDTIEAMLKMLRRLIGEQVELSWRPGPGLWPVRIDPAQVDQVLANLCVNARDAIDGVGTLAIDTDNVTLDAAFCAAHPGAEPGDVVRLEVRDTGRGMSPDVLANVFEPFFTTKPLGEGTGLGLATVYGIVKQNGGYIEVESRPGDGSCFRIYLPRCEAARTAGPGAETPAPVLRGDETILLVEDEAAMLTVTASTLRHLGYTVLAAASPAAARTLATERAGGIDLLLTDVIMPGGNGRALADELRGARPDLRVLFMSGYTADVLAPHGILDPAVHFIQKPFAMPHLAGAVRRALAKEPGPVPPPAGR